jgi:crotonobetainyl-CoA:carnitine CoA-transferase CaiB-like acyl-CoA transferase
MGCFRTADGHMNVAAIDGRMWEAFSRLLELPDDPRFVDTDERARHRAELEELVAARLRTRTTAQWIAALEDAGVPCGPVNDVAGVFADPQVRHLAMDQPVQHPELGELRLLANAATLDGVPRRLRTAAPAAGEHTAEILAELGLTPADMEGAS